MDREGDVNRDMERDGDRDRIGKVTYTGTWRGTGTAAVAAGTVAACLCTPSWQLEKRQTTQSSSVKHISVGNV